MGQPLLRPPPVGILSRDGVGEVQIDIVFVVETGSNAVDDAAGGIRVFKGAKEAVGGVVATGTLHRCGSWIDSCASCLVRGPFPNRRLWNL